MEKLLSAAQVADHLGIHVKTLYKQVRENTIALSFVQLHGRTIAFKPSEVQRFVELREIRRDGSGKKKKKSTKKAAPGRDARLMTDEDAQKFFDGISRREDGTLESDPNTFTAD